MKVIIAGSRTITDIDYIYECINEFRLDNDITEIVSGGAKGPDIIGEVYAIENDIPIASFIPDWDMYGKRAGIIRNEEMGRYADALIAIWDGKSAGTKHMFTYMKKLQKLYKVYQKFTLPDATLFDENI